MKTNISRSRVSLLRTLVLSLIMCDTVRRILEGSRPIDLLMLIIEVLVLALIAYEVIAGFRSKNETRRRIAIIFQHIEQGKDLQAKAPRTSADLSTSTRWVESVNEWVRQTHDILKKYSSQAATSFMRDSGREFVQDRSISSQPGVRDSHRTLISKIENLHNIVERPDVYF